MFVRKEFPFNNIEVSLATSRFGFVKTKSYTHKANRFLHTYSAEGDREMGTHKQPAKTQKQKQTFACVMSLDSDKKTDTE